MHNAELFSADYVIPTELANAYFATLGQALNKAQQQTSN